jgi:hypothetical protein
MTMRRTLEERMRRRRRMFMLECPVLCQEFVWVGMVRKELISCN